MHLAVLFEFPTLNGGERSLLATIDELRRQHADVRFTAFAPQTGPLAEALARREIAHIAWSVRDFPHASGGAMELALLDSLRALRPDIVHANSLAMGRLLGRIAEPLERPCTAHLRDIIGLSQAAERDLNRNSRLIAVSDAVRQHYLDKLDADRIVVIRNGVNLDEFQPRPATNCLHRELNLPCDARLCATIGQIILRKGWDVLAEAAILVAARHPELHFVWIGTRHSNKDETCRYETTVRERIDAAGLHDRVHWLGERDDVSRVLNEVDLLVHPAHQEPLGRVLIEAAASGTPIVATDVGGTREIIEPEESGRLVPPHQPAALANAMSAVLFDRAVARRYGNAARRRAEREFDIRIQAAQLRSCWSESAGNERNSKNVKPPGDSPGAKTRSPSDVG